MKQRDTELIANQYGITNPVYARAFQNGYSEKGFINILEARREIIYKFHERCVLLGFIEYTNQTVSAANMHRLDQIGKEIWIHVDNICNLINSLEKRIIEDSNFELDTIVELYINSITEEV